MVKLRLGKLLSFLLLVPLLTFGQRPSERDLQLFKTYFCDSVPFFVNLNLFVNAHKRLESAERVILKKRLAKKSYNNLRLNHMLSLYHYSTPNLFLATTNLPIYIDLNVRDYLNEIFREAHNLPTGPVPQPVTLEYSKVSLFFKQTQHERDMMPTFEKRLNEKRAKMKLYVKLFKDQATTLPLFYDIIEKAYNGKSDDFVDDLFDHSVFSNYRNIYNYEYYYLSDLRLRRDPLVIYSICSAQYMRGAPSPALCVANGINCEPIIQNKSNKDLFRAYFIDSLKIKVDVMALAHLYANKFKEDGEQFRWEAGNNAYWGVGGAPDTWWPESFYDSTPYKDEEVKKEHVKYINSFCDLYLRTRLGIKQDEEKARMKRLIKDFRKKAQKDLPSFYHCIDKKFRGNSDAYVDYLFEHSIFMNTSKFLRSKRGLKSRFVSHDPMVKYTLSVMQYLYCD